MPCRTAGVPLGTTRRHTRDRLSVGGCWDDHQRTIDPSVADLLPEERGCSRRARPRPVTHFVHRGKPPPRTSPASRIDRDATASDAGQPRITEATNRRRGAGVDDIELARHAAKNVQPTVGIAPHLALARRRAVIAHGIPGGVAVGRTGRDRAPIGPLAVRKQHVLLVHALQEPRRGDITPPDALRGAITPKGRRGGGRTTAQQQWDNREPAHPHDLT